jgi:hypothetical protein
MPVTYTNKGKITYYLHQGKTKTGKPKYYFSTKKKTDLLAEKVPDGFEVYEHPANAQVFLRKKQKQIITDIEQHLINKHLKKLKRPCRYIFDIKKEIITIFESYKDYNSLEEIIKRITFFEYRMEERINELLDQETQYRPMMRFILKDKQKRIFITERFCFKGSIDDWIIIGNPGSLGSLLKTYLTHLGKDTYYELI